MITREEHTRLFNALNGLIDNGRGSYRADLIETLFAMMFETDDLDDLYQHAEDLVEIAGMIRDEASANIENAQRDMADTRADAAYEEARI